MAKEYSRSERVAEQIQRELAQMVQFEINDPRIKGITITAVKLTRDMDYARVFFSILGDAKPESILAGLDKASGFIRRRLGKAMQLRIVPSLRFYHDESGERGSHLSALIDAAIAQDRGNSKS